MQPPLCHLLDCHKHSFIRGTVDVITVENLQPQSIAIKIRRYTITNESVGGSIVGSQTLIIHSALIIRSIFVLASVDDLHRDVSQVRMYCRTNRCILQGVL